MATSRRATLESSSVVERVSSSSRATHRVWHMQATRERDSCKRGVLEAAISIEMPEAARGSITAVPAPQTSEIRICPIELQNGRG